jgi:hypothetical protein
MAFFLIQFVMTAERHWPFSRLGTRCFENFFGMVRRYSYGDNRVVTVRWVIARASLVTEVMHELNMQLRHRGRDNVGGVIINDGRLQFIAMDGEFIETLIVLSLLGAVLPNETRSREEALEEMKSQLSAWTRADTHHKEDPKVPPSTRFSPIKASIVPWVIRASAGW